MTDWVRIREIAEHLTYTGGYEQELAEAMLELLADHDYLFEVTDD